MRHINSILDDCVQALSGGQIKSPCIGICSTTSQGDEHCRGCGRYFKDVIDWNKYSNKQKIEAMTRIKKEV